MPNTTSIPTHRFLYKIFPSSLRPPSSLPERLPLSSLDLADNFIHLSTAAQTLATASQFFASETTIYIGKIPLDRLKEGEVKYEVEGSPGCAHLYNAGDDGKGPRLGSGEIVDVRRFDRKEGEGGGEGWEEVLEGEEWLED